MEWATEDLHEKRQAQMLRSILWHLAQPTAPDARRVKFDAMKAYLDEDASAALALAVLGVKPLDAAGAAPRKKWHRAIVEAVERRVEAVEAGTPGHNHACTLGVLSHAPAAAAKYEHELLARFKGFNGLLADSRKADFVEAMMHLCGPSCLVTTRMYLLLPFGANCRLVAPRAMSSVPQGAPFELDVQYTQNRAISAKKSWVENVRAARVRLWGADAESDVCVATVIALTSSGVLCSVLAQIE